MAINILKAEQVKALTYQSTKKSLNDGGGLRVVAKSNGKKIFEFSYTFQSVRNVTSFGTYPTVSLAGARTKAKAYRGLIEQGINPIEKSKDDKKAKEIKEQTDLNTFEKLSREYLDKAKSNISEHHYTRTITALERDCFKHIGHKPINEITARDILAILHIMVERDAKESARKLFYSISKIFKWSVANYKADRNPTADFLLEEILGKKSKAHYPTITDDKGIKALLLAVDSYRGEITTKYALKLQAYTALRPFNIRHAEWIEIDFKAKQWNIPASKMKTKEDLIVPLTDTVINILEEMKQYTSDGKYIFHSPRSKISPMSDNTLLGVKRTAKLGSQ